MINNDGILALSEAKTIDNAIKVIEKYDLSDFDVRVGLRQGAYFLEYGDFGDRRGMSEDIYEYYKTLSSIYPYSKKPDTSPVEILKVIRGKYGAKRPDATDEKGVIKFFIGATDKSVEGVLKVKNALVKISKSTVQNFFKIIKYTESSGFVEPWNTQEIMAEMGKAYRDGQQDGSIAKGALKGLDGERFAKEIQGILPGIISSRSPYEKAEVQRLLGGEGDISVVADYFVRTVVRKCGISNLMARSNEHQGR